MCKIINILVGLMSSVSTLEDQCIKEYDETKTYQKGQIVVGSDGYFYEAKTVASGVFDSSKWTKIGTDSFTELSKEDIEALMGLTSEEIAELSSILLDTEVRLDKGWSSSKIFMSVKDVIDISKSYTLAELSKHSGVSYKVVSSTSEMTSESIIYLLPNATSYDMYIVEQDGTATRIGDTSIDLSNYFTKQEIINDYYDKATSDEKFATIDNVVIKNDISTTINSKSTNDTIPTSKAVYELMNFFKSLLDLKPMLTYTFTTGYPITPQLNDDDNYDLTFEDTDNSDGTTTRKLYGIIPLTRINFYADENHGHLISLDDTTNIKLKNMSYMFRDCSSLTSVNFNNIDTSGVTDMSYTFNGCSGLTTLRLDNFSSASLTSCVYMFYDIPSNCSIYRNPSKFTKTEAQTGFSGTFMSV